VQRHIHLACNNEGGGGGGGGGGPPPPPPSSVFARTAMRRMMGKRRPPLSPAAIVLNVRRIPTTMNCIITLRQLDLVLNNQLIIPESLPRTKPSPPPPPPLTKIELTEHGKTSIVMLEGIQLLEDTLINGEMTTRKTSSDATENQ